MYKNRSAKAYRNPATDFRYLGILPGYSRKEQDGGR